MNLSKELSQYIKNHGITLTFISKNTDIPVDRISRILNRGSKMRGDEFLEICAVLDIDPNIFKPKLKEKN